MKNIIASFAIIKGCFENGEDYISSFVPLMVRLFNINDYATVQIETISKDFESEYGISIPRHPLETILNRMRPRYISKSDGKVVINKSEIEKRASQIDFNSQMTRYSWLLANFIEYCKSFAIPVIISQDEADLLFTGFFKDHDTDIIFAVYDDRGESLFPNIESITDTDKIYLVNSYVSYLMANGGEHTEYLIDAAIGHKYASTILYREFSSIRGKGTCANYYFDVGILFDLAGINQAFRRQSAEAFLALLHRKGSSLWIFRHNYEEFCRILDGCLTWIESDAYDSRKASRTLQYFKDRGFSKADILLFIDNIPDLLKKNHIETANPLDRNAAQVHQIDRDELNRVILDIYTSDGYYFDLEEKKETLELDIDSIEQIYLLRHGNTPTSLNHATHTYVTTNSGLAYASVKFDRQVKRHDYFTIPAVLTDTFVGTFIWVQEPTDMVQDFSRSKLIAYTNAALQPRANFMNRFAQEVAKAKNNPTNPLSEKSASVLLESSLARRMLTDKTLGDPNRITAQTPFEIIQEWEAALVKTERARAQEAISQAEADRAAKQSSEKALGEQTENIEAFIKSVSSWTRKIVILMLTISTLIFYYFAVIQESAELLIKVINYVIGSITLITGMSFFWFGEKVETGVRTFLNKRLLKK